MTRHDKLVRDRIPAIIESGGQAAITHVADDAEYRERLRAKLQEEVAEYLADENEEELADIAEVLEALYTRMGTSRERIEALRLKKRAERGGFDGRIVLDETRRR